MRTLSIALLTLLVLASGATAQAPAIVGAIYITDAGNNRITRISDMTGAGWTAFGAAGSGPNQFNTPVGIYVDTTGHIYVADSGNHRIVRINDMTGAGWPVLERAGEQRFDQPVGIVVGGGRIYVTDAGGRVIRINDMTGAGWTTYGAPAGTLGSARPGQFETPYGIFFDAGRLYIGDATLGRIARINDFSGTGWVEYGLPGLIGNLPGQFSRPLGIFIDAGTRIYVADAGNNRLVRFSDMTGGGWVAFGSRGNRAGQFLTPSGIFVSSTGRIYVVDLGNNRIVRMNDMTGDGWTAFGAAGAEKDQFALPRSVFVR
jgi:DNA-binding beta-propeller fold protein YncE